MQRLTSFGPAPWGPGEGSKGQMSFKFSFKVIFKDFVYQTMCVFSHMNDTKTFQTGFSFCGLDHAPGLGLWGAGGVQGGSKNIVYKHGHVAYQINGDDEQNRMQVKFSS